MKFTIEPKQFRAALNVANAARSTKATLAILNSVLITAKDDRITVVGTDMDSWFEATSPAQVRENGEGLVNGALVSGLADKLNQPITITVDNEAKKGLLISGKSEYKLGHAPADEYPVAMKAGDGVTFTMNGKTLAEAVRLTYFASDLNKKTGNAILESLLLDLHGNAATFIGTDKHRLSYHQCALKDEVASIKVMVAAGTWSKIADKLTDANVEIIAAKNLLQVKTADAVMVTRLMNGQYPNYEKVIPSPEHHVKLDRAALLAALQRLRLLFDKDDYSKVVMTFNSDGLKLEANSESDTADETISCDVTQELKTAFQINYLTEVLSIMNADEIDFGYTGAVNPILLTAASMPGFQYVGMPREVGA